MMAFGVYSWMGFSMIIVVVVGTAAWIMHLIQQRDALAREKAEVLAKAEVRRKERHALQSVIEREAHGIINFDRRGTMTYANGTAEGIFGFSREELIGASFRKVLDEESLDAHGIDIARFRYRDDQPRFDVEGYRSDGSKISLDIAFTEFDAPEGTLLVAFVWDTTERKQEQARLLQALHAAEVANRTKSAFLANVSHEVRTPMTAIIGMAELCLRTELDDTQHDYLTKLHDTSRSLLGILNDILDFSKIEAGELKLEHISFRIDRVLDEVATVMRHRAFQQGLELIFRRDADVPDELVGDPMRLKQVLINLCTNAIKFTEVGEIELCVTSRRIDACTATLEFLVRDTGIGMTREQTVALFKPFSQGDSSTSRKYGGTGLGLSISKHLVELMGGEIDVKSRPGRGSVFTFSAIFALEDDAGDLRSLANRLTGDAFKGMAALIVDDNQRACDVLGYYLESFGFEVDTCTTRACGIDHVRAHEQPYDLILFDDDMEGDVAADACIEVVGRERLEKSRIIVMAHDRSDVGESDLASAIISKPANPSSLLDVLMDVFGCGPAPRGRRAKRPQSPIDQALAGARVLLVEDNKINQQVALELLKQAGFRVDVANNGVEALIAIEKTPYDCVLMDIQMPEMDGYEATRRLRQRERFKDLPVLAMTANALMDAREQMLAAGMNDHISKPIDSQELLDAIRRAVHSGEAPETGDHSATDEAGMGDHLDAILDRKAGLRHVNGNEPLYQSLLKEFARDNGNDADEIERHVAAGDLESAKRVAHTLKGLVRTIGAAACYQEVRSVDELLRHGLTPDRIMIGKLRDGIDALCREIGRSTRSRKEVARPPAGGVVDFKGLRALIAEMDPAAESTLEEMIPAIRCKDDEVVERLARHVRNYEFDKALESLDEVERLMS